MTLTAVRELLQKSFPMWLAMALFTLWNVFVLGMALGAWYHSVFTGTGFKLLVNRAMASTAHVVCYIFVIGNFQRRMNRMTGQALFHRLAGGMRLVAFHAARNISMFLVMALGTLDFRMLARVGLKLLSYLCMAVTANLCKVCRHGHLCFWGMRT